MRAGSTYVCGHCARTGGRRDLCHSSCQYARDENGNAPPKPRTAELLVRATLIDRVTFEIGIAIRDVRARSMLKRALREVGPTTAITTAEDGWCRIEGKVHVLDAVTTPDGRSCAAFLCQRVSERATRGETRATVYHTHRQNGRFAVIDDSGTALIDDDYLRLFDHRGNEPDITEHAEVVIANGAEVTVVGRAFQRPAGVLPGLGPSGFRSAPHALVFEGGTRTPILVFAPP